MLFGLRKERMMKFIYPYIYIYIYPYVTITRIPIVLQKDLLCLYLPPIGGIKAVVIYFVRTSEHDAAYVRV